MYRLLIIDSEEKVCSNITQLLDWSKYGVTSIISATSYPEAITKAIEYKPDIALINTDLGEHKGYDIITQLRDFGLNTIFCMISDVCSFPNIQKSLQMEVKDFLLKPLTSKDLINFLNRVLKQDLHNRHLAILCESETLDPILHCNPEHYSKITKKILVIIKNNYQYSLSLTIIGNMFNMSNKYIGRIFLQETGMKFTDYLSAYRMMQAKELIANSLEKISVIAQMVGYSQLNNFYVQFKKYYHISPNVMRQAPDESCSRLSS